MPVDCDSPLEGLGKNAHKIKKEKRRKMEAVPCGFLQYARCVAKLEEAFG